MNPATSWRPGLVSVTFRPLSPERIVAACVEAKLQGIEWGGDVHVPTANLDRARAVHKWTLDAGLEVAAYGSYYRVGTGADDGSPFERVLETAQELGAPLIRVWAGKKGSRQATEDDWKRIGDDARRITSLAHQAGIRVALEHHGGTLADNAASTLRLLERVNQAAPGEEGKLRTLWQPQIYVSPDDAAAEVEEKNAAGLEQLLGDLENLHVFWWTRNAEKKVDRLPLSGGESSWRKYFEAARKSGRGGWALLEFMPGDDPQVLGREAEVLRRCLEEKK